MKRLLHGMMLCGTLAASAQCEGSDPEKATVKVRVYDFARLESRIATSGQRQAAKILNRAGIKTEWFNCAVTPEKAPREAGCIKPPGARDVVLKLLPDAMARKLNRTADTFGLAVPTSPVGLGTAYIFVEQAEQLAFNGPFSVGYDAARAVVLGHLIAHEIGHLLLGPGRHSSTGIMTFPWSQSVLRQIARAHLSFTADETELIRERLAAGLR